jgi:hypothetical protein
MAWRPDYATTDELAAFVRIDDSLDDAQLALAIAAASRAVDRASNRQFGLLAAPAPRFYTAQWDRKRCRWYVVIDDLMTSTGLSVAFDENEDETYSSAITDHRLQPANAAAEERPWTELAILPASTVQPTTLTDGVRVTAQWGWTAVPTAIKEATLLQASRLLARRDSPYGVAGSPDAGSEVRLQARLDPDVAVALGPYRRVWGAV